MEQFGVQKRNILLGLIEEAQAAQKDGQDQFRSALEQFSAVVNFNGGELQQIYDWLNTEFEDSEAAAAEIRNRIDAFIRDLKMKRLTCLMTKMSSQPKPPPFALPSFRR